MTVIGAGAVSCGGLLTGGASSVMVTVDCALPGKPQESVAEKVTVVVPSRKLAGALLSTVSVPSSASVAVAEPATPRSADRSRALMACRSEP